MKKLILLLLIALTSCSEQGLEIQDLDIIIIDPANLEFYKLNHAEDSGMGWVEKPNGYLYTYKLEDGKVFIAAERPIKSVMFVKGSDREYVKLSNNAFSYDISDKTVFRIYY